MYVAMPLIITLLYASCSLIYKNVLNAPFGDWCNLSFFFKLYLRSKISCSGHGARNGLTSLSATAQVVCIIYPESIMWLHHGKVNLGLDEVVQLMLRRIFMLKIC